MSSTMPPSEDRLLALLADQATQGLSADELEELNGLLDHHPEIDPESMEFTAAAIDLALCGRTFEELPPRLRRILEHDAPVAKPAVLRFRPRTFSVRPVLTWSGWAVAACLCITIWATRPETIPTLNDRRAELVRTANDLVEVRVAPPKSNITGDVVWSTEKQEGYVRLRGLEPNDPKTNQYQLWIVDQEHPIAKQPPTPAGIFNVPSTGEVILPVRSDWRVYSPKAFVVTRERAGGVVVSDLSQVVVMAPVTP